jgi:peptidoglycan/xylan/chitin deacetylase (PgdA/CDA1 family)
MKYITIFIDFEGKWGSPKKINYDLPKTVNKMLLILKENNAKAVFNTSGIIFSKYPKVIKNIIKNGHEISLHGYEHENFLKLPLIKIKDIVKKSEAELKKITKTKISGIRAPYLMGPKFYKTDIYTFFKLHKYRWVSNREIRFVDEIFRPDRVKNNVIVYILNLFKFNEIQFLIKLLYLIINYKLVLTGNIKILLNKNPYIKDGLVEIPLTSFLDCDMVDLPNPTVNTDQEILDYTYKSTVRLFRSSK